MSFIRKLAATKPNARVRELPADQRNTVVREFSSLKDAMERKGIPETEILAVVKEHAIRSNEMQLMRTKSELLSNDAIPSIVGWAEELEAIASTNVNLNTVGGVIEGFEAHLARLAVLRSEVIGIVGEGVITDASERVKKLVRESENLRLQTDALIEERQNLVSRIVKDRIVVEISKGAASFNFVDPVGTHGREYFLRQIEANEVRLGQIPSEEDELKLRMQNIGAQIRELRILLDNSVLASEEQVGMIDRLHGVETHFGTSGLKTLVEEARKISGSIPELENKLENAKSEMDKIKRKLESVESGREEGKRDGDFSNNAYGKLKRDAESSRKQVENLEERVGRMKRKKSREIGEVNVKMREISADARAEAKKILDVIGECLMSCQKAIRISEQKRI